MEQVFHSLVQKSPDKLLQILQTIIDEYYFCKSNLDVDHLTMNWETILRTNLNKLFYIKTIPVDKVPISSQSYMTWIKNIDRLSISIQQLLFQLQQKTNVVSRAKTIFHDWDYATLQENVYYNILENVFVGCYTKDVIHPKYSSLLLRGVHNSGKTFFLTKIKEFLERKNIAVLWKTCSTHHEIIDAMRDMMISIPQILIIDLDEIETTSIDFKFLVELKTPRTVLVFTTQHTTRSIPYLNPYTETLRHPSIYSIYNFLLKYVTFITSSTSYQHRFLNLCRSIEHRKLFFHELQMYLNQAQEIVWKHETKNGTFVSNGFPSSSFMNGMTSSSSSISFLYQFPIFQYEYESVLYTNVKYSLPFLTPYEMNLSNVFQCLSSPTDFLVEVSIPLVSTSLPYYVLDKDILTSYFTMWNQKNRPHSITTLEDLMNQDHWEDTRTTTTATTMVESSWYFEIHIMKDTPTITTLYYEHESFSFSIEAEDDGRLYDQLRNWWKLQRFQVIHMEDRHCYIITLDDRFPAPIVSGDACFFYSCFPMNYVPKKTDDELMEDIFYNTLYSQVSSLYRDFFACLPPSQQKKLKILLTYLRGWIHPRGPNSIIKEEEQKTKLAILDESFSWLKRNSPFYVSSFLLDALDDYYSKWSFQEKYEFWYRYSNMTPMSTTTMTFLWKSSLEDEDIHHHPSIETSTYELTELLMEKLRRQNGHDASKSVGYVVQRIHQSLLWKLWVASDGWIILENAKISIADNRIFEEWIAFLSTVRTPWWDMFIQYIVDTNKLQDIGLKLVLAITFLLLQEEMPPSSYHSFIGYLFFFKDIFFIDPLYNTTRLSLTMILQSLEEYIHMMIHHFNYFLFLYKQYDLHYVVSSLPSDALTHEDHHILPPSIRPPDDLYQHCLLKDVPDMSSFYSTLKIPFSLMEDVINLI